MDYLKLYTFRLDTKRQLGANRSNLLLTKFYRITHITALGHQLQSFILKRPFCCIISGTYRTLYQTISKLA